MFKASHSLYGDCLWITIGQRMNSGVSRNKIYVGVTTSILIGINNGMVILQILH